MFMGVHGEDQQFGFRKLFPNPFGSFDAVHAGHCDIHDHDVRFQRERLFHGNLSIGGFPDDFQVGLLFQQASQTLTYDGMIIRQQNFDGFTQ